MKLNQLPQIAEETLAGLTADQALYHKIKYGKSPKDKPSLFQQRRLLVFAGALVLLVGMSLLAPQLLEKEQPKEQQFQTHMVGFVPQVVALRAGNLPQGSINLGIPGKIPEFKGVWANSSGGNFPLIRVNGAFYRLLKNPTNIDAGLLGTSLGTVEVFTEEPALETSGQLLSNVVSVGTQVSAINGMPGTALGAMVDGRQRVFQRVSFSGNALLGSESLIDTLRGSVAGLQLSGVGTVTDAGQVSKLMSLLFNESSYQNSATANTSQALLIQYSNGIVLQMAVKGDNLISCGTWNNPGFIEAFKASVQ